VPEPRKQARCAIYTRKSTEHNLDLEFNSLDAQREACEAYIKSQAHEGWRLAPGQFDDGGISGGSLDRPALTRLISEIEAGRVDVVVVYKVDRLTRSLTDFAKLVDLFDRNKVSFVSITQAFNTTTSMGRLTLNVLLSFAQFEREVIGERVRDKIWASKKKGLWMGGPVPLGYCAKDKKLVIEPGEAETVRGIFRRYLELGSLQALATDLHAQGARTKQRNYTSGRSIGGVPFTVGPLAYLLKNRTYVGEIVHRNEISAAEHQPIVDRELFDAVQQKLAGGAIERKLTLKGPPSLLAGKLYDDRGNPMTPSHTVKKGVRYRYYVSRAILKRKPEEAGSVSRVPAAEIEAVITETIQAHLETADLPDESTLPGLDHAIIKRGQIEMHLAEDATAGVEAAVLTIPWEPTATTAVKGVVGADSVATAQMSPESRDSILEAIAKSRLWMDELLADQVTIAEIAEREGKGERYIRMLLGLAFVAPATAEALASGVALSGATITKLVQALPIFWARIVL
jgi:DNA invertase Pin-like site-specific DNA recombinase